MLIEDRITATRCIEEAGAKELVGQQHGHRARKNRHDRDQKKGSDQPSPYEQGHFHQGHARCPHVEDCHDDIDRGENRRDPENMDSKDRKRKGCSRLENQRRVKRPASRCRTPFHK